MNGTSTTTPLGTASAARSLLLQLAAGAALGLVVLYGVAFAESPVAHNAAHDVRHVTVKPCH
ncbi:CbtB domain-containing protein [Hydrogenophaga laconesensis]|uniref:Cobalt transporter subunit CbtB n=1 Tax=Hydrogenophaga laconesensis TaxID=1805971 RepID=A0ABU1V9Z2_9BURK|nr:CbtB-domain containing protein [Hydrogenophaga laconesensis]MDR7094284.1 cobalt transporter subunit CbtB [Hydrogenophaga laconesensis]